MFEVIRSKKYSMLHKIDIGKSYSATAIESQCLADPVVSLL